MDIENSQKFLDLCKNYRRAIRAIIFNDKERNSITHEKSIKEAALYFSGLSGCLDREVAALFRRNFRIEVEEELKKIKRLSDYKPYFGLLLDLKAVKLSTKILILSDGAEIPFNHLRQIELILNRLIDFADSSK